MRHFYVCGLLLLWISTTKAIEPETNAIHLDLVTYKQLGGEVRSRQGSVILVDFWASYCQPCLQKLPHVIALYNKYRRLGLQVVTVSLDDVRDGAQRELVKRILVQQQAMTRNLQLTEDASFWSARLKMDHIPTMMLFDDQGRLINRWTGSEINLAAIEKRIVELLPHAQPK